MKVEDNSPIFWFRRLADTMTRKRRRLKTSTLSQNGSFESQNVDALSGALHYGLMYRMEPGQRRTIKKKEIFELEFFSILIIIIFSTSNATTTQLIIIFKQSYPCSIYIPGIFTLSQQPHLPRPRIPHFARPQNIKIAKSIFSIHSLDPIKFKGKGAVLTNNRETYSGDLSAVHFDLTFLDETLGCEDEVLEWDLDKNSMVIKGKTEYPNEIFFFLTRQSFFSINPSSLYRPTHQNSLPFPWILKDKFMLVKKGGVK